MADDKNQDLAAKYGQIAKELPEADRAQAAKLGPAKEVSQGQLGQLPGPATPGHPAKDLIAKYGGPAPSQEQTQEKEKEQGKEQEKTQEREG